MRNEELLSKTRLTSAEEEVRRRKRRRGEEVGWDTIVRLTRVHRKV